MIYRCLAAIREGSSRAVSSLGRTPVAIFTTITFGNINSYGFFYSQRYAELRIKREEEEDTVYALQSV